MYLARGQIASLLLPTCHCETRPHVVVVIGSPVQVGVDLAVVPVAIRHVGLASWYVVDVSDSK